jgi:hypothetical protein
VHVVFIALKILKLCEFMYLGQILVACEVTKHLKKRCFEVFLGYQSIGNPLE